MILAGDLGGTKTLLALCQAPGPGAAGAPSQIQIEHEATFASAEHASLDEIVERFLRGLPADARQPAAACFGVAGPVQGDTAHITNLSWTLDAASLSRTLGGAPVVLLNDLQAAALGMLTLPPAGFVTLQPPGEAAPRHGGTIAVVAPGTGLGQSLLVSLGGEVHALPMEAGHVDFAATTDEEYQLVRFLRQRHGHHISNERVLCGDGLADLYAFVRASSGEPEPAWLTAELASPQRNAAVSTAALQGRDACCVRALEMFVEILGSEAGNAALRGLARGGVILGGGIPPKILRALQDPRFLTRFRDKGRFAAWMESLEVRVALEPRAGLFGAAHRAAVAAR